MIGIIACGIYVFVSLVTFTLMGLDKHRAKRGLYRIPERSLLIWGTSFGSLGLWAGMALFRHKTKKIKFIILSRLFFVLHIILLGYLLISPQSIEGIVKQFI